MTTLLDAGLWRRRMRQLLHQEQRNGTRSSTKFSTKASTRNDDTRPGCACGDPGCRALVPLIPAPREPLESFTPRAD